MKNKLSRRNILKQLAVGSVAIGAASSIASFTKEGIESPFRLKNNINHSVCQWTFGFLPLDELCKLVKEIGFSAIDLIAPKDWPTLQRHGIYSSMCYISGEVSLTKGFNHKEYHDSINKGLPRSNSINAKGWL